jgi:cleavage and polyadenylation specificity factor subunit 1
MIENSYEAVKYFRHMLEARHFIIFTDHKPITYAFQQKRDECSPRQFNHHDFIAQFTTDTHVSGQDNVVADALSCVGSVTAAPSQEALTAAQNSDEELRTLLAANNALRLEKQPIPGTTVSIYCDTSAGKSRPYIPAPLRLQVFQFVHSLSHPGTKATAKLASYRDSFTFYIHTYYTFSESLGFGALCIVWCSRNWNTQYFGNWICFHSQVWGESIYFFGAP